MHVRRSFIMVGIVLVLWSPTEAANKEPVAYYDFRNVTGTVVRNENTDKQKAVIHGAKQIKGEKKSTLLFDGIDDFVEVPDARPFQLQQFSFGLWFKPAVGSVPLISKKFSEIRSSFLLSVSRDRKRLYCFALDKNGETEHWIETRDLQGLTGWTHVVFTCDSRWVRLYVNGKQETFAPVGKLPFNKGQTIPYTENPLQIGRSFYAPKWKYFKGEIAELRVYNRALAPAEVLRDFRESSSDLFGRTFPPKQRRERLDPVPKKKNTRPRAKTGEQLILVKGGKSAATIVIPRRAKYWTGQAAKWLGNYIEKTTGAKLPIVAEDTSPSGTLISVGQTELARKAGVGIDGLKWDGCKLVVKHGALFLIGRDVKQPFQNAGGKIADGNCRAVVTFLEDFCGIRWFLPGRAGEFVPRRPDISVPGNLEKTVVPAFAFSSGRFPFGSAGHWLDNITPAAIANNYRKGAAATTGGHTYYAMVPAGKYFKDHPEYFAVIDGKRTGEGNHLCSTNPEVKRLLVRGLQKQFDKGFDIVTLGQEDGFLRCQCPDCEKLDDYRFSTSGLPWLDFQYLVLTRTRCERLFLLHKAVIDEVHKTHPQGTVLLFGYAPTAWPSKKIDRWGDKVWVELASQDPEIIEAWKGKTAGVTGYVYWFDIQLPMGMDVHATPAEVARRIRFLHENGFQGLYHFPETNFGFQGPAIYTLGKLMGDPYRNHNSLVEEYCRGVFGEAAEPMLEFFNVLDKVHEQRFPFHLRQGKKWPPWLTTSDLYLMLYSPEILAQLQRHLTRAEQTANSEQSRGWVRHTRDYFDFTRLLTATVTAYREHERDKTKARWIELKQSVEQFNRYRMKVLAYDKQYTDRWFPGHGHFCNWLTGNTQHESKVYYTPWKTRKPDVLSRGVRGLAIGYGGGPGYSFVKEPLTLNFQNDPP